MMKFCVVLLLAFHCSFGFANKIDGIADNLDDLNDYIEFLRAQESIKDLNKFKSNKINEQKNRIEVIEPYINQQSQELRLTNSKMLKITLTEYLKRDEIGSVACEKYGVKHYFDCYWSVMMNISLTEFVERRSKATSFCSNLSGEKLSACRKNKIINP